ncbi:MAG TPA: glycosyl hydrolase 53 family protein, partial [Chitinophagaceae bacterium]|nr:glycosyl hydrolase 53 family protein [Chitinophagaceae bacterium]
MKNLILVLSIALLFQYCKKENDSADPVPVVSSFAKGADVSWVTEMETAGRKFHNSSGAEQDLFSILKGLGMNTIR